MRLVVEETSRGCRGIEPTSVIQGKYEVSRIPLQRFCTSDTQSLAWVLDKQQQQQQQQHFIEEERVERLRLQHGGARCGDRRTTRSRATAATAA